MSIDHGKDLLFGVIALQMNFITQEQFVEVMTLLPGAKGKTAEELFVEKGYVREEELAALRGLIQVQLARNGGDIGKSIAAFEGNAAVEQSMMLVGAKSGRAVSEATTQTIVLERKARAGGRQKREDRYVLGHELGRGGLGKVLLAMDRDLMGREVAMKLMLEGTGARAGGSPPGSTPPARARFLEEAQVTA